MGKKKKKPHRPVVSARVPLPLYEKLKSVADASGRTMGEELIWRVQRSFETPTIEQIAARLDQLIKDP